MATRRTRDGRLGHGILLLAIFGIAANNSCIGNDGDPTLVTDEDVPTGTPPDDDVPAYGDAAASRDAPTWETNLIDLVFLVDNSGSMREEQQVLAEALPAFLARLYAAAESAGFAADVNVGVISPDLGTAGFTVSTCVNSEVGDDACLRHEPNPGLEGCAEEYPPFLHRSAGDPSYPIPDLARDFACIATLGTNGCGFEQQLEATRAAVVDNAEPGACNEGLVRPGSVVALVVVSDEDDCSADPEHPEMFDPTRNADLGHLNIRCFLHPEFVESLGEYLDALRSFEATGHAVVFGALVGVPPDAPECNGFGDELAGCLSLPEMIPMIDPAQPTQLLPSCNTEMGLAFPPVRFVQAAQDFAERAYVASICRRDYKPFLDSIVEPIIGAAQGR
jgi:hypothetical protein